MNTRELGAIIKQRREFLKISQTDLAEISEVGLRNLKDLETGKGNPRFNTLSKIINTLGLEITIGVKS